MASSEEAKKRKLGYEDGRSFKIDWERDLFYYGNGAECLVCGKQVACYKRFNLKRHYDAHHASQFSELKSPSERDDQVRQLKAAKELSSSSEVDDFESTDEKLREVSYWVALELSKVGHSFSDGELIKKCLLRAASIISPLDKEKYENIPLSRRSITRRVKEMGDNVKTQLRERAEDFVWYSLCLDESTDVTDTAQLAIFIRGVDKNMNVTEELLDVIAMHSSTTAKDVFNCVENALIDLNLPWQKLCSVSTDGAPAMLGVKSGLVKLIKNHVKGLGVKEDIIGVDCVIHRENLCAKSLKFKHVMNIVTKTIISISHRQFTSLSEEFGSDYQDLTYYCEVRFLSRGLALDRFWSLLEQTATFMESKGKPVPELRDSGFVRDLAFLCDLCKHLNVLNVMLQGGNKLVTDLFDSIKAFKQTLTMFEEQLKTGILEQFHY